MSQQPEAFRLAYVLATGHTGRKELVEAGYELRRLLDKLLKHARLLRLHGHLKLLVVQQVDVRLGHVLVGLLQHVGQDFE
mgnify:CR=1 FL=1